MNRRAFLGAGAALVAGAAGVRYAPLVTGDAFESLVADALGVKLATATALLDGARRELGDGQYDRRAAQFALAVRSPLGGLIPESLRRRAVDSFLGALLLDPTHSLALALDRPPAAACGGLIRPT